LLDFEEKGEIIALGGNLQIIKANFKIPGIIIGGGNGKRI